MKISESREFYDELLVPFTPDRGLKIPAHEPVTIHAAGGGAFLVTPLARPSYCFQASAPPKERAALRRHLEKSTPMLAYTLPLPKREGAGIRPILVQIRFYAREQSVRSLEINLDEAFSQKARRSINIPSGEPAKALEAEFVMQYGGEEHIVAGFPTGGSEPEDEMQEGSLAFIIAGRERYLKVVHRVGPEGSYYACESILSERDKRCQVVLLHGKISFMTEAGRIAAMTAACVRELKQAGKGYLETWTQYGEQEGVRVTRRCLEGGVLHYRGSTTRGNTKYLHLTNPEDLKPFIEAMPASDSRPVVVLEQDPSELFGRYRPFLDGPREKEMLQEARGRLKDFLRRAKHHRGLSVGDNLDEHANELPLKGNTDGLPEEGHIIVDTRGEQKVTDRRERARDAIASATCAMPDLAMLLEMGTQGQEERGLPGRKKQARGLAGLTPEVRRRIFTKNKPTPRQEEAIDIAINTPDIALIQGPPGTGKTTVITAIAERLKELYAADTADFACILVTAYQHAAVENAIERMRNYDLPVVKADTKQGENPRQLQMNIEKWRSETLKTVEQNNPELEPLTQKNRLLKIYQAYLQKEDSIVTSLQLLQDALQAAQQLHLPAQQTGDLRQAISLLKRLRGGDAGQQSLLRRELMNLPCSAAAYEDGGPEVVAQVRELLRLYDQERFAGQIAFLEGTPEEDPKFFPRMIKHRTVALAKLLPRRGDNMPLEKRTECARLLKDLLEAAQEQLRDQAGGLVPALLAYRDGLSDGKLVKEAMMHYSYVSGATNQHSASAVMKQLQRSGDGSWVYDTVIVDEAARSNPLDLMIPLALARDRIILVGDHRQLPHMVDDELEKTVLEEAEQRGGADLRSEEQENLKVSLFQKLFESIQVLEKKDGIKRTVTLDRQYRMHPLLGNFVSDNFYAPYGEKVDSPDKLEPLPERFAHALPGLENKACVWLQVPASAGGERPKDGTRSWMRKAEAEAVAGHLGRMLASPAGRGLTFGVITFYAGQALYIKDLIRKQGIAEEAGDTGLFRLSGEEKVRLQVGTVDAFQGKEFDVVYLSIVRCNKARKYGFLTENRLCVSMSRQKKLLVVAGDPEMVLCRDAEENVPALKKFYELCRREEQRYGAILQGTV